MKSKKTQKKYFNEKLKLWLRISLIIFSIAAIWGSGEVVMSKPLLGGFDCATGQSVISTEDCIVLATLYADTDGAGSWTLKTNWFTSDPCTWYGITCELGTSPPRPVTLIKLNNNNLVGTIPSSLGTLSSLTYLGLGTNTLTGTIPSELGNLSNLDELVLANNNLDGLVPSSLGSLSALTGLYLNDNPNLGGKLPSEIGNLSNLIFLYLANTDLYGALPQSLTDLSALDYFYFNATNLCEPQNINFQAWYSAITSTIGTGIPCTLFMDEFETGDFCAWSRFNDGNGYLYPCHMAAINGSWGACVDRGTDKRKQLIDETPVYQTEFKVRFNIDMNSLSMAEGTRFRFMQVKMASERPFFLVLKRQGGEYKVQLNVLLNDRTKVKTGWYVLSDAPHTIEVEWGAASFPGGADGWALLYIDDVFKETFPALLNDSIYVDTFKIGFTSRLDGKPISGMFFLDDVATGNLTHIGLPSFSPGISFSENDSPTITFGADRDPVESAICP